MQPRAATSAAATYRTPRWRTALCAFSGAVGGAFFFFISRTSGLVIPPCLTRGTALLSTPANAPTNAPYTKVTASTPLSLPTRGCLAAATPEKRQGVLGRGCRRRYAGKVLMMSGGAEQDEQGGAVAGGGDDGESSEVGADGVVIDTEAEVESVEVAQEIDAEVSARGPSEMRCAK